MVRESARKVPPPAWGSIVSTKDVPPTAWKNGAGTTREVAAFRSAGSTAEFDWRISVADLERSALFSAFPGIDRTFLVASGAGVILDVDGTSTPLGEGEAVSFPGEREVSVALPQGPATAVNFMTARSYCGVMETVRVEGKQSLAPAAAAVLVLKGSARTSRGEILQPMDFLLCGTGIETLHFSEAVAVFIDIRRR